MQNQTQDLASVTTLDSFLLLLGVASFIFAMFFAARSSKNSNYLSANKEDWEKSTSSNDRTLGLAGLAVMFFSILALSLVNKVFWLALVALVLMSGSIYYAFWWRSDKNRKKFVEKMAKETGAEKMIKIIYFAVPLVAAGLFFGAVAQWERGRRLLSPQYGGMSNEKEFVIMGITGLVVVIFWVVGYFKLKNLEK